MITLSEVHSCISEVFPAIYICLASQQQCDINQNNQRISPNYKNDYYTPTPILTIIVKTIYRRNSLRIYSSIFNWKNKTGPELN